MWDIKIIVTIAYALIVLFGGAIGYLKAKSKMSLISGTVGGALLSISGLMQWQGNSSGRISAIAVTGALAVVFAIRTVKTRKFIPAGLLLVAGIATLAILLAPSPIPSS